MTGTWVYNGDEWVQIKRPHYSTGTGFVPVDRIWQQTGADGASDWLNFWTRPATAPNTPGISVSMVTKTRNQFNVSVTMPNTLADGEISRCVVKVGVGTTPNPPNVNDGRYYTDSYNGEQWSEWFTDPSYRDNDAIHINVGASNTKRFPATYQPNITLPLNTAITFSVWIQDEFGNWSMSGTQTINTLKSTDAPYGANTYTTVIMPYKFDEWSTVKNLWMYRGRLVNGQTLYCDPSWVRSTANPYWWTHTGGLFKRITYLYYGSRLRKVINTADEVVDVKFTIRRRYDTTVNMSGGKQVNDADYYGPKVGAKLRVWACTEGTGPSSTVGSTSHLIPGTNSEINTGTFAPGAVKTFSIPENTWKNFKDGVNSKAYSLAFYAPNTTGSSTDPYSLSYGLPMTFNNESKWNQADLSGYITIVWRGYGSNPWPTADPSHPDFRPAGAPSNW